MLRLTFLHRRNPDLDPQAFAEHWHRRYAARIVATAADLKITRAIFVTTADDDLNEALIRPRGAMEPRYDGVTELWWHTNDDAEQGIQSAAATDLATEEADTGYRIMVPSSARTLEQ
ncbi:MAG: hypothetical protein CMQ29_06830 [Gammaproteobacteria bacterium]|jgi:hypothetical protein|nr:hypothetical protein [Gammaproteobacteria bacterium]